MYSFACWGRIRPEVTEFKLSSASIGEIQEGFLILIIHKYEMICDRFACMSCTQTGMGDLTLVFVS